MRCGLKSPHFIKAVIAVCKRLLTGPYTVNTMKTLCHERLVELYGRYHNLALANRRTEAVKRIRTDIIIINPLAILIL